MVAIPSMEEEEGGEEVFPEEFEFGEEDIGVGGGKKVR